MKLETTNKLTAARTNLVLKQPFFGMLALRMQVEASTSIESADIDGITLRVNEDWVASLTGQELEGVLAHEIMHCAAGHHVRRRERDQDTWERACDLSINGELLAAGFVLPKEALHEGQYDGKSAESIYASLQQSSHGGKSSSCSGKGDEPGSAGGGQGQPQPGQSDSSLPGSGNPNKKRDPGKCGTVSDLPAKDPAASTPTEAEREASAKDWQEAVAVAAQAAKGAGKLPGALDRLAKAIVAPRADWRALLRRFLSDPTRTESTWARPNRRTLASDIYMPSNKPSGMGEIALIIDVSGSIDDGLLQAFACEINGIVDDVGPAAVHVVYCDAKVQGAATYTPDDFPIALRAMGGGGTNMAPALAWLADHEIRPVATVVLTDLEFGRWPTEPEYPVLWAVTGKRDSAPWGEVVSID